MKNPKSNRQDAEYAKRPGAGRSLGGLGVLAVAFGFGFFACHDGVGTTSEPPESVLARLRAAGHAVDASLANGAVRYLGFEAWPEGAVPGDTITVVHWWAAARPLERPYRVFVHTLVQGARGWVAHGDHDPAPPTDQWPAGSVLRDEHKIQLPAMLPADALELRVGLYSGNARLPVDRAEQHDGQNAIRAGRVRVQGTPVPLPSYRAPRLAQPPVLDGAIDDAEWGGAPWIDGFLQSLGRGPAVRRTRARLAWDDEHLFVAMQADDPDVQASFERRDEPIYKEEALEIFIDADADGDTYEELQVSPKNVQFDASFAGGPRRNMRTDWNATYTSAVKLDGTVDDGRGPRAPDADRGWSTEWAIDVRSLPDAKAPLAEGTRWRINLFRIAKDRLGAERDSDESAWSPPLMGDFHNLERFGELWFVR
jgi:hypothetical protein